MNLHRLAEQHMAQTPAAVSGFAPASSLKSAPWVDPPENFEGFDLVSAISTPAVATGDVLVLGYRVPRGYDGVIRGLLHAYVGSGFQQGAGGILWRLKIDNRWVRHYDAMTVAFGSVQVPKPIAGVRIYENNLVQYFVNVAGGAGLLYSAETQIVCGISGWIYPRGLK